MNRARALLVLALLAAASAAAEAPSFRFERPVTPTGTGPQALAVDVPLLAGASSPRLQDLRLFDAAGREVPWLLVPPPDPTPSWRSAARILPIKPTKEESGFEADLGAPLLADRLRVDGLGAPLLKPYRLEGSGDRARWTLLVSDGTLFDLPDEKLRLLEATFVPVEVRYLRVTWDDRRSARPPLPAEAAARSATPVPVAPSAKVSVPSERRESEPGKSRFSIRLPGPHLPIAALELQVSPGPLLREGRVLESRLAQGTLEPIELGSSVLRRAERFGGTASDLRIPVRAPEGTDLSLVVDDGDNPPLALTGVLLDLGPQPWIFFESAAGEALTARFGAPSLAAPRYDLEAIRESLPRTKTSEARWGDRRDSTAEGAAPTPIPLAGAPIGETRFGYRRPIPATASGLVSLSLDAAVLAHSRGLTDLRIVDAKDRQVPYLVERRDEPLALALPAPIAEPRAARSRNVSRYVLGLPFDSLPPARLVLTTSSRVFDRTVRLLGTRPAPDARTPAAEETLASSRFAHADPETAAPPLVLAFVPSGLSRVTLEVDEGDNSPLPLGAPKLLLPSVHLRFFAPAGEPLALLYGAELGAPKYDIELLAPRLAFASAREVSLAPESAAAPEPDRSAGERRLFWIVLVAAVLVLLGVTARLLTKPAQKSG